MVPSTGAAWGQSATAAVVPSGSMFPTIIAFIATGARGGTAAEPYWSVYVNGAPVASTLQVYSATATTYSYTADSTGSPANTLSIGYTSFRGALYGPMKCGCLVQQPCQISD